MPLVVAESVPAPALVAELETERLASCPSAHVVAHLSVNGIRKECDTAEWDTAQNNKTMQVVSAEEGVDYC